MANSNGWGDGASNNLIGWGQGADNAIGWGDSHLKSWAGATDIAGFDSAAISYFNATGISGATQQDAIDNLVRGLKDDGIWSKMKALYPFVTDQRNLCSYSEDFANGLNWGSAAINRTGNTITAPNGTLTADTIVTTSNVNNVLYNTNSVLTSTGDTFTNSVYLKYNNAQWLTVEIWYGNAQNGVRVWVDVLNGVLGTANATTGTYLSSSIVSVGNGWYRVSITGNPASGSTLYLGVRHVDGNGAYNFTSVSGKSTYIWGGQCELGTLTEYQPQLASAQSAIASQFKYNLVNPVDSDSAFRLVFNGGWTHSAQGALPNGTNGYADTFLIPSAQLTTTSGHLSTYSRSNTNVGFDMGADISTNAVISRYNNLFYAAYGFYDANVANTDSRGHFITNRNSATKTTGFKNGSKVIDFTLGANLSSFQIAIGSIRTSPLSVLQYSNKQTSFASIGNGLTDAEAANLYTRVQAFQTALNRQV